MRSLGWGALSAFLAIALALRLAGLAGLPVDRETAIQIALAFSTLFAANAALLAAATFALFAVLPLKTRSASLRAMRPLAQLCAGAVAPGVVALLARAAS